jgi:YVTN family beta-propeller protein
MRTGTLLAIVAAATVAAGFMALPAQGARPVAVEVKDASESSPFLMLGAGGDTTCVFYEDFQDGVSGWTSVDLLEMPQDIHWNPITYQTRGVMWCGDSLPEWVGYGNSWEQYLTKDFTLAAGDSLVFLMMHYDMENNYDHLYFDISDNEGMSYTTLEAWTGRRTGFLADTVRATGYTGSVRLRLRFQSDGSISDEDGAYNSDGAVHLDWVQVRNHAKDEFTSGYDEWTPSVPPASQHDYRYRLEEAPACEAGFECEDYCWSWVAYDSVTLEFPHEEPEFEVDIGIASPIIDIPTDASQYLLKYDIYANLPQANRVFYRWEVASPPIDSGGSWVSDNFIYWSGTGFSTITRDISPYLPAGATQLQVRLSGLDMCNEWGDCSGVHTAAPMFDNVGIFVRDSYAPAVSDVPTPCASDGDGDGVFGPADLCSSEDASFFDSSGDGCIDDGAGARHIEYWDRGAFPLTYKIHQDGAPEVSDGSDFTAVTDAMDAWTAGDVVASATYGGTTAQADAKPFDRVNMVTFEDPDYQFGSGVIAVGLTTSFTEPTWFGGRWYRAGEIMDSDILFNGDPGKMRFKTMTDGPAEGVFIESVAAHELGHLFGLAHTPVRSSTMYGVLPSDTSALSLEMDDQMAMFKAYATTMTGESRLTGTVTDGYTDEPLPGAAVFAISAAGGDTSACEYTLPDGTFSFIGLPDGDYYVAVHPLDGSSAIGGMFPAWVNALVETTAVTLFVPESWDSLESAHDDAGHRSPIAVSASGPEAVADIVTNIDDMPPEVTAVVPDSGAVDVSIDTSVLVVFSERINGSTLQGNFNLTDTSNQEFVLGNATLLKDDSLLAFIPLSNLAFSTTYELMLEPGIQDGFGNGLADTFFAYFTTEDEPDVALASIAPSKGVIGMTVSLNGKGFAPEPANNTVSFNGTAAVVSEASATQLVVTVPQGATSGPVSVYNHTQGLTSNSLQFTVLSADEVPKGFQSGICALGGVPYDLTVVPSGDYVFVATDEGVEVVDSDPASSGYMTSAAIPISGGLTHLDAGPTGSRVYGVSGITNKFYRLSSTPGSVGLLSEKPIDAVPRGIIVHPRGHRAFIPTDEGAIQVWDIEEASPTFETQIGELAPVDPNVRGELATYPAGGIVLAITGTGKMFVANLDSNKVTNTVSVGVYPEDIAIDPLGDLAYVCDQMGFVSVISLSQMTNLWKVKTGGTPDGIALTPAGSFAVVVDRQQDILSAIDLRPTSSSYLGVVATIDLPVNPTDVELSPDGDYAFTISEAEKKLSATALGVGPALATMSRLAGPVGARLVLAGSGFSQGTSTTVTFGGVSATPEELADSSLAVVIPSGALSGDVSVITEVEEERELASNAIQFEVLAATEDDILRTAGLLEGTPSPAADAGSVLCVSPDGDYVALADLDGGFHVLAANPAGAAYHQYAGSFDLGSAASDVAITPDGRRSFVVLPALDSIYVLSSDLLSPDFLTRIGAIDFTGVASSDIARAAVSPDGTVLLVSDPAAAKVHFVDIREGSPTKYEIAASTALGSGGINGQVAEIAFHPGGEYAYLPVLDPDPAVVLVLDTDTQSPTYRSAVFTLTLPGTVPQEVPISLAFTPSGDRCLVLTSQQVTTPNRTLVMLNSSAPAIPTVSKTLSLGGTASPVDEYVAVSPRGDRAIAAVRKEGLFNLEVRTGPDSLRLIQEIGESSHHLTVSGGAYAPDASRFYSLSESSDTLTVYDFSNADTILVHSGNNQAGVVNRALAQPLKVKILGENAPASGVAVEFSVVSGGGSFAGNDSTRQVASTGADGIASVEWTLGPDVGSGAQTVSAAAPGLGGSPVEFWASGLADPDALPLAVVSVAPDSGATGVSIVTAAQMTFSRAVDSTTVRDTTVFIHDGDFVPVAAVVGFADENRKVSLSPVKALTSSKTYRIEITTDVLDEEGGPLSQAVTAAFATQPPLPKTLTAIQPPSAPEATPVVLSGSGFYQDYWLNTVYFDTLAATVTGGGVDYLSVVVPIGAPTCSVKVKVGTTYTNTLPFTLIPPGTSPINNVTSSIATTSGTRSVAITPDGGYAYAVSPDANMIAVLDLSNLVHLASIAVGENPVAVTIDPTGTFAYVANYVDGTVSIIDIDPGSPDYNEVVDAFAVGVGPTDLAMTPDGDRLVVANLAANGLSVIDTDSTSETYRSVVTSIATGSGTRTVAITPDGGFIYVGTDLGYLVISGLSYGVVTSIATGSGTRTVAITPDGGLLVVLTTEGDINIYDINQHSVTYNQVVTSIKTGSGTSTIAISPDGGFLYMIQQVGDVIIVGQMSLVNPGGVLIDGTEPPQMELVVTLVDSVVAGEDPACIAFDPSGSGKYIVTNAGDNTVTVLDDPVAGTPPTELPQALRSFPNPFSGVAMIRFGVPEAAQVDVSLYDVRGRLVKTIVSQRMPPGSYTVSWDGKDARGNQAASGVYFCRLSAGAMQRTSKMVILR